MNSHARSSWHEAGSYRGSLSGGKEGAYRFPHFVKSFGTDVRSAGYKDAEHFSFKNMHAAESEDAVFKSRGCPHQLGWMMTMPSTSLVSGWWRAVQAFSRDVADQFHVRPNGVGVLPAEVMKADGVALFLEYMYCRGGNCCIKTVLVGMS